MLYALLVTPSMARAQADSNAHRYAFVVLRSGPESAKKTPEERKTVQAGHMANINRLAEEGVLLVAGPFGLPNPDPTRRGIFIFDVSDLERARTLTSTDPAVQAGVFAMDLYPLETTADLHVPQAADRKVMADAKAAGKDPNANFPMHNYTLGFFSGADTARAALVKAGALLVGRIGDNRWLAILDAPDVAKAEAMLAPVKADLEKIDLTPWYASANILTLKGSAR